MTSVVIGPFSESPELRRLASHMTVYRDGVKLPHAVQVEWDGHRLIAYDGMGEAGETVENELIGSLYVVRRPDGITVSVDHADSARMLVQHGVPFTFVTPPQRPTRASGGPVQAGREYWAGDDGPIDIQIGPGARIEPTSVLRAAHRGVADALRGPTRAQVEVNVDLNGLHRQIADYLEGLRVKVDEAFTEMCTTELPGVLQIVQTVDQAALRAELDGNAELKERLYARRNRLVILAVSRAMGAGIPAGFRFDPKEPDWPVAFIELPGIGQVSWHLSQHPQPWDGHSPTTKNDRLAAWLRVN